MPTHVWTVLCMKSSLDQKSNNLSLFDITEQLNIKYSGETPAGTISLPGSFELVSLWIRTSIKTPERPLMRVTVVGPGNTRLVGPEREIDLQGTPRCRTILKMSALPISGPGYHYFSVESQEGSGKEWHEVARIPLEIQISKDDTLG